MKIRTQLILSTAALVLMFLFLAGAMVVTSGQVEEMHRQRDLAEKIQLDAYQLDQLTNDYLLNREFRQEEQWQAQYAILTGDLDQLAPAGPEQQALAGSIRTDTAHLGEVFTSVSAAVRAGNAGGSGTDETSIRTSWSRLTVENQAVIFDTSQLLGMINAETDTVRQTQALLIAALLGAILAIILVNYLLVYSRILTSVAELRDGTEVIGRGDLGFRIREKGDDEFRDLAVAFNVMTANRKRAEELMQDREFQLRNVIGSLPAAMVYTVRIAPDGHRTFTFISGGVQALHGCSPEEAMADASRIYGTIAEEEGPAVREQEEQAAAGGGIFSRVIRLKTLDNMPRYVYATARPRARLADGSVLYDGVELDITDLRRAEEALHQKTTDLEAADEELRQNYAELARSERKLRESEEHYRLLADNTGDVIWLLDPAAQRFTYVSPSVEKLRGYTPEEVLGQSMESVMTPESYEVVKQTLPGRIARFLGGDESQRTMTHEVDQTCRDGSVVATEVVSTFLTDERGKLTLILGVTRNIADRRKAESALRESEARYRHLFENMQEGLAYCRMIYEPDGTPADFMYLAVNNAFDRIIGAGTVINRPVTEIFPGIREAYPQLFEIYGRVARTGVPGTFDVEFAPVGKWLHISVFSPAPDHFVAVFSDITERKKAEDALILSEERLRLAQDAANAGTWEWDLATNENFWSEKTFQLYDLDPRTTTAAFDAWRESIHPDDRDAAAKAVAHAAKAGIPVVTEWRVNCPAGQPERWLMSRGQPVKDHGGTVVKYRGIVIDITERKHAESERERMIRDLEEKNAELERFTYTISHDLKSPLITILGYAGLLEEEIRKGDTADMQPTIRRITSAAKKMEQLLADVLQLSRIGRIVAPPEKTSFTTIAQEAADLIAIPLKQRGVRVEIALDMPVVYADHNRIREVMVNLIENAVKYMGGQKHPRIQIGVSRMDGEPVFFVRDNGIGIEPAYLERIFNLFEKLDPDSPGTGVGLTIVKRIIEVHGGKIWAESEGKGKGATFRFTLPLREPAAARTDQKKEKMK